MAWIKRRAQASAAALLAGGAGLLGAPAALALDCTKASTAIERAICTTPALMEQDTALTKAYLDKLAGDPGRVATLRAEQRAWLAERGRLCGADGLPPQRVVACLAGLYRGRLVALSAGALPGAVPPGQAAQGPRAPVPPGSPPVSAAGAGLPPRPAQDAAGAPLSGPPAPIPPSLPASRPAPEAVLAQAMVPARGAADQLLEVRVPGRFAIRAESRSGVALQLVDMIAGPGAQEGEPGVKDGRLDVLLDRGTYKLRSRGAEAALGEAKLLVQPFRELGDAASALVYGGSASTTLSDLGQRSYWVAVAKPGRVSVEAVGRSLGDLRLWRNGTDLAALTPLVDRIAPGPGHAMTRVRLTGAVEPGLYLVTAYGGPKLAWSDPDPAEALHLRVGPPEPMAGSWVEGVVGAIGSVRFEAPAGASAFRLELPDPAPATLSLRRDGKGAGVASIAKNSREPVARLDSPAGSAGILEVAGQEGQPFRLRALDPSASRGLSGVGPHWVAVDVAGEGADEMPATVLLAQLQPGKAARVLASNAPQIGPGRAWRQKLNARGPASLLFEVTAPTPVAVTLGGLRLNAAINPLLGNTPPRSDGRTPRWDLEPGWYELKLTPQGGAFGVVDVTLGPPGVVGEAKPGPSRPSIPLGINAFERGATYQIYTNAAPNLVLAPTARALPARLETQPFVLYQEAGQALDIPLRVPMRGYLAARGINGVPIPVVRGAETTGPAGRTLGLRLPPPERGRGIVLSWSNPALEPLPALPDATALDEVAAGTPRFFDLARDETKSFALNVAEGGLYRVETLGRLQTEVSLATPLLPQLDAASANGAGRNALAQTYLRAGRYAVRVKASESNGHMGLVARAAALDAGATLVPDGSVRASLADGHGLVVPVEIAKAGRYRLELYALGEPFRARLEDEAGWPLTVPGPLRAIERAFEAGRYRLVVLPKAVEARAVLRLSPVVAPAEPAGHGPHPLAFDADRTFQWREPAGASDARVPDRWEFALAGPADINLDLTPGMTGDLTRVGESVPIGRIVAKSGFAGRLPAGRYAVEARSLGRNDRLDYTISLRTREIQPDVPRRITLPATIPFAIAQDRVVNLTSFGRTDLRGVLKDGEGRVIERLDDRGDDWNIGLSRQLAAGAYTLDLAAVDSGPTRPAVPDDTATEPGEAAAPGSQAEDGPATEPAAENQAEEASPPEGQPDGEDTEDESDDESGDDVEAGIDIRLTLPETHEGAPLDAAGSAQAEGAAVQRFALPSAPDGSLLVAAARARSELVLSLERSDASGRWRVVGFERGLAPLVAVPSDGAAGPWRVSVWAVDGGPARMEVAARVVARAPADPAAPSLEPVPFGDVARGLRVARVAAPSSGVLRLQGRPAGLLEGSALGRALQPLADDLLVPQAASTWIVTRGPGAPGLSIAPAEAPRADLALIVPAEGRATFPASPAPPGTMRVWRADSAFGQPALDAGQGFGVAAGSALAPGGDVALRVWNAGGSEPLGLRVRAVDLAMRPAARAEPDFTAALPAGAAQPVTLPSGRKRLTLDLAAGTGAILGADRAGVTIWSGGEAVSRTLDGDWTRLVLLNPGPDSRPVRAMAAPLTGPPIALTAGAAVKSFFGAAGSLSMRVDCAAGDRLVVAGAGATFVGADGRVARGTALTLTGPGELVLDHPPGLVAAWVERPGRSPWPQSEAKAVALPSSVPLSGAAMALAMKPAAAILLHARSNAPVILALSQTGREGAPMMFPAGAEFHRLVAPGEAMLRLYSPHDGPLSGTLDLTASAVIPAGEGMGEAVALAPGGTALFGFEVKRRAAVGIGVRAEPDLTEVRLLDAAGRSLGGGVAQLHELEPGRYVVEASVPPDGRTTLVRPAIVGLAPPPSGPPPDVVRDYMQLVGLAPTAPAR